MTESCWRFCRTVRPISRSSVLVIHVFAMSDPANNDNVAFHIKQDAIIAGPQSVSHIRSAKMFDVAVPSGFQSFNLAQDLFSNSFLPQIQSIQCGRTVFDSVAAAIHWTSLDSQQSTLNHNCFTPTLRCRRFSVP